MATILGKKISPFSPDQKIPTAFAQKLCIEAGSDKPQYILEKMKDDVFQAKEQAPLIKKFQHQYRALVPTDWHNHLAGADGHVRVMDEIARQGDVGEILEYAFTLNNLYPRRRVITHAINTVFIK